LFTDVVSKSSIDVANRSFTDVINRSYIIYLFLKISDALKSRFEVPFLPETDSDESLEENDLDFKLVSSKSGFGFKVVRKSNNRNM
jgi:hypothetical protein